VQVQVGGDAFDGAPVEGAAQQHAGALAVGAVRDHLGEQRVVVRRHGRSGLQVRVYADGPGRGPGRGREMPGAPRPGISRHFMMCGRRENRPGDRARARAEVRGRVLCVEPDLDRVAVDRHAILPQAQRPAFGDRELLGDDVDAGDRLGDRVLDLDAGIDLEEVELAAFGVDEELDRARPLVAQSLAQRDRRRPEPVPQFVVQAGRGRFLDELLVAPLHRAVPVAQVDEALAVPEELHLDMPSRARHTAPGTRAGHRTRPPPPRWPGTRHRQAQPGRARPAALARRRRRPPSRAPGTRSGRRPPARWAGQGPAPRRPPLPDISRCRRLRA
jgi:hypothetical protein